jgi:hypothetical protein
MIGIGTNIRKDGIVNWKYTNICVPDIRHNYDGCIFNKAYEIMKYYIDDINKTYGLHLCITDANIYHWGSIEKNIITNMYDKYYEEYRWEQLTLVDMYKIFISEPIIIKGAYNYSLKTLIKALIKHGLVDFNLWEDDMSNGLDAMYESYKIYKEDYDVEKKLIKIGKYNEIDVKALDKIIEYMRNKKISTQQDA